jgi:hypothetical protein
LNFWFLLFLGLLCIRLSWQAVDSSPMLFLGDSESYLQTALSGYIPPDRSFSYGFIIRAIAFTTGSIQSLILVQMLASIGACLLIAIVLVRFLNVSKHIAFAMAAIWAAIEPLGLMYERYIMTEAFAQLALAVFVLFSVRYIRKPSLRDLFLAHLAATVLVSFRTAFVPVSLCAALMLPVLGSFSNTSAFQDREWWRKLLTALAVSLVSVLLFHQSYKVVNGQLAGAPPAYQYSDGFFLLAAWVPIVEAHDFDDQALGGRVLTGSTCPRHDLYAREAQRWLPSCTIGVLQDLVPNERRANQIARRAALSALYRDPSAVLVLAARTWLGYFDRTVLHTALRYDRGERQFQPSTIMLLEERLRVEDAKRLPSLSTPTNRLYLGSSTWISVLALCPLWFAGSLVACRKKERSQILSMIFLTLLVGLYLFAVTAPAAAVVPRYFHPLALLVMVPFAVVANRLFRWGVALSARQALFRRE